ncbi:MAG: HlyD family efflux transporter periplasmic adaptor subunit [Pirellulales bacterium]|nr:HlyD family efflux transporter periplasmic adaptor subunit [Pirellulales bacterium]
MKTRFSMLVLFLGVVSAAHAQPNSDTLIVPDCRVQPVSITGQAQVPAEEAGRITTINVREGIHVRTGDLLATIDDAQAQKQKQVAIAEHRAAKQKADSDIDILHADAAAKVAEYDYRHSDEANQKTPGAVSQVEMEQKKFQWKRALYAIQQAKNEQIVNSFTADAKLAEAEAADVGIQRRKITSPIDGVVQQVKPSLGEWVKPGDTVFRIIRMDRLRVDGYVDHKDASPGQLIDRPVVVEVELVGGQKATFTGNIVFVDPEVTATGQRVHAEIDNRQDNGGHWLLRPGIGMKPTMTIQLR